jgi:hypothetical protein
MADLDDIHSTLEEIRDELSHRKSGATDWIWIILVVFFFSGWAGSRLDRWTDRVWYSLKYDAKWENTDIQKRPLNCDFLHSPVGGKGCSYKKKTSVFGDAERRTLLAEATIQEDRTRINNLPNSVTVYWEKKEE